MDTSFLKKASEIDINMNGHMIQGSYTNDDCIFLLKDITNEVKEFTVEEKEDFISKGINYSEILSIESPIKEEHNKLFLTSLKENALSIAKYVGDIAESIYAKKGESAVIVSLARAGTPIGILVKNYLMFKHKISIPHYSVSIIREKGIDENAIIYILSKHPNCKIQFVDGWTGKGSISLELQKSMKTFYDKYGIIIDDNLAVLADPAKMARICGTRRDVVIPNCYLNATVSGLISRTYHNLNVIKDNDFHGAKVYRNLIDNDFSNLFLNSIRNEFINIDCKPIYYKNENYGTKIVDLIANEFSIKNENKIKLSIGESSRALIRRIPKYLLIKNIDNPDVKHLITLAKEKDIPIIKYDKTDYEAIAIIAD